MLGRNSQPQSSFCLFVPKLFRCSYKIVLFVCTVGTLLHLLSSLIEGNGSTKYLKAFFHISIAANLESHFFHCTVQYYCTILNNVLFIFSN